jgi:hypothetical protein
VLGEGDLLAPELREREVGDLERKRFRGHVRSCPVSGLFSGARRIVIMR